VSGPPPREPDTEPSARWRADLALAIVALIWGTTFVIVKSALRDISAVLLLALRFGLASVCLLAVVAGAFRKAGSRAVWRGLRGGAICGAFLWLGYLLQTTGLKYTAAGRSAFLTGLYIVLVPAIAAALDRRMPKLGELAGLAIASAGMLLLTVRSLSGGFQMNRGDLLTIGCAVAFAFQVVALGYYSQRENFEAVAFGQIAYTAILSGICLPFQRPHAVWTHGVIFAVVVTGVFATALAFALQTWAQQRTTATRTALLFALEPVFALATAAAVAGERLSQFALTGCALILAGIVLVELKPVAR
jgi:drug/metabolite transporter (DMT)-like permease